jgi:hypothetical protein
MLLLAFHYPIWRHIFIPFHHAIHQPASMVVVGSMVVVIVMLVSFSVILPVAREDGVDLG